MTSRRAVLGLLTPAPIAASIAVPSAAAATPAAAGDEPGAVDRTGRQTGLPQDLMQPDDDHERCRLNPWCVACRLCLRELCRHMLW